MCPRVRRAEAEAEAGQKGAHGASLAVLYEGLIRANVLGFPTRSPSKLSRVFGISVMADDGDLARVRTSLVRPHDAGFAR